MTQIQKAALPNTLKKRNYLSILNVFRGEEELSANDVAERTGISRATVMKAVAHFIKQGLLESAGKGSSTEVGGKKPALFRFCMQRYLLCVGLCGKSMVLSVYDLTAALISQRTEKFESDKSVGEFLDVLQNAAEEMLRDIPDGKELLYGVSLFAGGVFEMETGTLQYSVITPKWGYNVPLKQLLAERFPGKEVVVDNVARMSACATVLDNEAYEEKRVAVVYSDVGVSACYIDKGHVLHGPNGVIGEIGQMVLSLSEGKPYEKDEREYFASFVGTDTLCKYVLERKEEFEKSALKQRSTKLTVRDIFEAADSGDALAMKAVRKVAWAFSAAFHNIILNFDPEVIIMQGNYAYAGKWFEECVREGLKCFPRNTEDMTFTLEYDRQPLIELQMIGATKLLTRKFFSSSEWI